MKIWIYALAVAAALAVVGAAAARPPGNDNFVNATPVAGDTGRVTGTNVGATTEAGEPEHTADASRSVWYSWAAPATGAFTFETCGSDFDTVIAVYTGASIAALAQVAADDDSCDGASSVSFAAVAGTSYTVAVGGYEGETGAIVLEWKRAQPPANDVFAAPLALDGRSGTVAGTLRGATREPDEPAHGTRGGSVWFAWTAPTSGVVEFAVSRELAMAAYVGSTLGGAKLVRLSEPEAQRLALQVSAGTTYRVAVAGSASSSGGAFDLEWAYQPEPVNDSFARPHVLIGESGNAFATLLASTVEPDEPTHGIAPAGGSVWFAWRAPLTGRFAFTACAGGVLASSAVYVGDGISSLRRLGVSTGTCRSGGRIAFDAVAGTTYRIAVGGSSATTTTVSVTWARPPVNDDFAGAIALGPTGFAVEGTTIGATRELGEGDHREEGGVASVWYSWTAPSSGFFAIGTCGSAVDAKTAVYTGDALRSLVGVASELPPTCSRGSAVRFRAAAETTYRIAVDASARSRGSFTLRWQPALTPDNDGFTRAAALVGASGEIEGSTVGASREANEPRPMRSAGASVWYRWSPSQSGWFVVDTCSADFDTVVAIYRGTALRSLRRLVISDDECDLQSRAFVKARKGVQYRILVAGLGTRTGSFRLHWQRSAPPQCVVPWLVDDTLAEARLEAAEGHCRLAIRYVASGLLRRGHVVAQSPSGGKRLPHGALVTAEVVRR